MGNVSYAINERVRRILKYVVIGVFLVALAAPFFIFSTFGASKIHDWALENDSGGGLFMAARIHCIMGTLSEERYEIAESYFHEFISHFEGHEKYPYAVYYVGWCMEEQKRYTEAKAQYEYYLEYYPGHDKASTAEKAINRIEAYGVGRGG
jgi:hypothetical protein